MVTGERFDAFLEPSGDDVTVVVRGAVDERSVVRLDAALDEAARVGGHVTVDLTGVPDVGPRGVETLQRHVARLSLRRGFTLRAITPVMDHLLQLGFGDLLGVRRRSLGLRPVVLLRR